MFVYVLVFPTSWGPNVPTMIVIPVNFDLAKLINKRFMPHVCEGRFRFRFRVMG